jgi:dTDP-4-amino-4,6-dideoxygalactose transaminase
MITTNSKKVYESAKKMRDVGRITKYTHDRIAYTLRLNSVNAAIGREQLKHLDEWNDKRRSLAKRYSNKLDGEGDLILPPESDVNNIPVYHMYVIRTRQRNALGAWLSMNNISTGVHYPIPVHRQPAYQVYRSGIDLSFTNEWSNTVLSIPIYPGLEHKNQEYVIEMIKQFYDNRLYESKTIKKAELVWSKKLV